MLPITLFIMCFGQKFSEPPADVRGGSWKECFFLEIDEGLTKLSSSNSMTDLPSNDPICDQQGRSANAFQKRINAKVYRTKKKDKTTTTTMMMKRTSTVEWTRTIGDLLLLSWSLSSMRCSYSKITKRVPSPRTGITALQRCALKNTQKDAEQTDLVENFLFDEVERTGLQVEMSTKTKYAKYSERQWVGITGAGDICHSFTSPVTRQRVAIMGALNGLI